MPAHAIESAPHANSTLRGGTDHGTGFERTTHGNLIPVPFIDKRPRGITDRDVIGLIRTIHAAGVLKGKPPTAARAMLSQMVTDQCRPATIGGRQLARCIRRAGLSFDRPPARRSSGGKSKARTNTKSAPRNPRRSA